LTDTLPESAIIARLGGDEFAVVTVEKPNVLRANDVGHQIQVALARVFEIGGRTIEIGASVGVAISPSGEVETVELIRRADIALYRAKDLGRGMTIEFEDSFDEDTNRQADLETQLRTTLAAGGIDVSFQPLIDARSGAICGVEALARWVTDSGVRIGPDVFIPLAERSGLIDLLGSAGSEEVAPVGSFLARHWPGGQCLAASAQKPPVRESRSPTLWNRCASTPAA
jgi:predicted signal transduction protein with EAL and GGDEF domain